MNFKMTPRLETINPKKLVGRHLTMSLAENNTGELWRGFMAQRKEITNNLSNALISMQVYQSDYFKNFNPANKFEKWVAVEVVNFENVPSNLDTFVLSGGLYAVFHYKGQAGDSAVFQYIFQTWLPNSDYILDDRPHFEILGDKYKNNAPDSEEEIWIPVNSIR